MLNDKTFQELCIGYCRYEAVRKLNLRQFTELYNKNLKEGVPFDSLVDELLDKEPSTWMKLNEKT